MLAAWSLLAIPALLGPAVVVGHGGGLPFIHVPSDHIEQGMPFTVVAADLGENSRVDMELRSNELVVAMGTATAGPDGHFETSLVAPTSFPDGYAQLTALGDDGSRTSVWVRIGEGPDLNVAGGPPWAGWRVDPALALLAIGAASTLVVVLVAARRRGSRSPG